MTGKSLKKIKEQLGLEEQDFSRGRGRGRPTLEETNKRFALETESGEELVSQDTGCILHPSCLTCPEPVCAYEFPGGLYSYLQYKMIREGISNGGDIYQISERLGMTVQKVQRIYNQRIIKKNKET